VIEPYLVELRLSREPGLDVAMRYPLAGGGKRIRPRLTLAAARAGGADPARALPVAAAVELIHTFSLVHDDLPALDDDDERRGRPTVHVAFGEAIAILAGDGLLTEAFGALAELGPDAGDAVAVLAKRAGGGELLVGQAIDLTSPPPDSIASLERLHAAKTGALFAASAELGAIAADASVEAREALGRYGLCIGIAFQHADDRDDREFAELAAPAAQRMRALCVEARDIAKRFGSAGATLDSIAAWIAARA
jgi:geranylgeranyl pyrophosphate synthase